MEKFSAFIWYIRNPSNNSFEASLKLYLRTSAEFSVFLFWFFWRAKSRTFSRTVSPMYSHSVYTFIIQFAICLRISSTVLFSNVAIKLGGVVYAWHQFVKNLWKMCARGAHIYTHTYMYIYMYKHLYVDVCVYIRSPDLMNVMIRGQRNRFSKFIFIALGGVHKLVVFINNIFPSLSRERERTYISIFTFYALQ